MSKATSTRKVDYFHRRGDTKPSLKVIQDEDEAMYVAYRAVRSELTKHPARASPLASA